MTLIQALLEMNGFESVVLLDGSNALNLQRKFAGYRYTSLPVTDKSRIFRLYV